MKILFIAESVDCIDTIRSLGTLVNSPRLGNHEVIYNELMTTQNLKDLVEIHFKNIVQADAVVAVKRENSIIDVCRRIEVTYEIAFAKYLGKEIVYYTASDENDLVLSNLVHLLDQENKNEKEN